MIFVGRPHCAWDLATDPSCEYWLYSAGSSMITASFPGIMRQFNVGTIEVTTALAVYVFAYGFGALVFSPLSEVPKLGRNVFYIYPMVRWSACHVLLCPSLFCPTLLTHSSSPSPTDGFRSTSAWSLLRRQFLRHLHSAFPHRLHGRTLSSYRRRNSTGCRQIRYLDHVATDYTHLAHIDAKTCVQTFPPSQLGVLLSMWALSAFVSMRHRYRLRLASRRLC